MSRWQVGSWWRRWRAGEADLDIRSQSWAVQVGGAVLVFTLSAWVTVTSVSYFGSRSLLSETFEDLHETRQAHDDLLAESRLSTSSFVVQVEQLEAAAANRDRAITELTAIKDSLSRQLESRERQLASVTEQRDRARTAAQNYEHALAGAEQLLDTVIYEKSTIAEALKTAKVDLADAVLQRDAGRRVEVGLRWELARLENDVNALRGNRESTQVWLQKWVLGSVEALEQLFGDTGVDLEMMIARAAGGDAGQGGPLQSADFSDFADPAMAESGHPMNGNIHRLAALQRLAQRLPLASPLDHFHVTSPFGKRRDPFTKGWAYHSGLDLGAARGSQVLATAPGEVIFAGGAGPYGNMVEIDHGMGIVTRYGHLQSVDVEAGDRVGFRTPIGVIGNTGRSSGRHTHYEIRIDEQTYDPARFLEAGRFLVGVLGALESAEQGTPLDATAQTIATDG